MTKQKQEQAATPSPSPALFSLHPTLFFLFSSLDSNFQFTPAANKRQPATTKAEEDEPSHSQGDDRRLPAMDHVRKRHQEKGFLYDWSVNYMYTGARLMLSFYLFLVSACRVAAASVSLI
uniref:Uncharacterized protein n=1 Tax=Aegilops tauschii subsp. strangulata TaxID=200361 RepID=A0A453NQE2_AEGTS